MSVEDVLDIEKSNDGSVMGLKRGWPSEGKSWVAVGLLVDVGGDEQLSEQDVQRAESTPDECGPNLCNKALDLG